jgi:putative transposase
MAAQRGRRRRYDELEKSKVLDTARTEGVTKAIEHHGVPKGTVYQWVTKAYEEEGPERWPLYKRRERGGKQGQGGKTDAGVIEEREHERARIGTARAPAPVSEEVAASPAPVAARKRRVAKSYTPSQRAQALAHVAKHGVSKTSKKYGMSRTALYDWLDKEERAQEGKGPSPTEGPDPADIEAQRDREILAEWHQHPGLGPSQIRNQLRRSGIKVAVQTVRNVMLDAGYRPPKQRSKAHDERFEAVRPNHMWHLDFLTRYINRAKVYILILLDDCSRYATGFGISDDAERAQVVIETFEQAVECHGRPEMTMHDKGSAFWSWRGISQFTSLLTEMGIDQIVAEHKEWNGKLECFNGNLQKELFDVRRFADVADMRRGLAEYLHWYNHQRTHHALGGGLLVPADRYYGRHKDVLARLEAGLGQDDRDPLGLRGRAPTLFQIVDNGGVLEAWFLGRRLLSLPQH